MSPDPVVPWTRIPSPTVDYVEPGEFLLKLVLAWMVLCAFRYALAVTVSIVRDNRALTEGGATDGG